MQYSAYSKLIRSWFRWRQILAGLRSPSRYLKIEWVEELMFPLVDQVFAVGIEHLAIALEHIDHLNEVIGGVAQQGLTSEEFGDDLLGVEAGVAVNQLSRNDRHLSSLPSIAGPRR